MRVLVEALVAALSSFMLERLEQTLGSRLSALEERARFIDIPRPPNDRLQ